MNKFLVRFEFNYHYVRTSNSESGNKSKRITIGVYDTFDEAAKHGNEVLEYLEKHFLLNPNCDTKVRFSKDGGCFGFPKDLISNVGYLRTPFYFCGTIKCLVYEDFRETILNIKESEEEYNNYPEQQEEE